MISEYFKSPQWHIWSLIVQTGAVVFYPKELTDQDKELST
jgi:hypothetical protein